MISMTVLAILGSPSQTSRTAKLVDRAADILQAADIQLQRSSIHDFPAQALLHADFSSEAVKQFQQRVARAQGIIIATPVYKAAYAGALKVLLDLIPEGGLTGKPVLPLASGGSPGHLLAVDYAIKPVLAALKASEIHQGVFAVEAQIARDAHTQPQLAEDLAARLEAAVSEFIDRLPGRAPRWPAAPPASSQWLSQRISL